MSTKQQQTNNHINQILIINQSDIYKGTHANCQTTPSMVAASEEAKTSNCDDLSISPGNANTYITMIGLMINELCVLYIYIYE